MMMDNGDILTSVDGCRMVSARPTRVADHRLARDATERLSAPANDDKRFQKYIY